MSAQSDSIAATVERHADAILKIAGDRADLLSALLDLYAEAYREGADFALGRMKQLREQLAADIIARGGDIA